MKMEEQEKIYTKEELYSVIKKYDLQIKICSTWGWLKFIIGILLGVVLVVTVSAAEIYSGDTYIFPLEEEYEYYTVVSDNDYNETDMNISWENKNVTINFHPLFQSDTITIIFFNEKEVVKTITVGGGGGGGGSRRTIYKDRNITNTIVKEILKELAGEKEIEIEVETVETNEIPWWIIGLVIVLIMLTTILFIKLIAMNNEKEIVVEEDN